MDEGILTQLAIQLARQQNPEGRISEKDVERAMSMIKNLIEEGNMPPASMMKDTTTSAYGDAGRGREVPDLKANYGLEVIDLDMNEYSKLSREYNNENPDPEETGRKKNAGGGIMGMPMGQPRVNKGGVTELDYRAKGGFVPVGIKEKADDVPAMLSKNEFVFTADAVRGAGNGSIEKGAQKMYDTMKNLERRVT